MAFPFGRAEAAVTRTTDSNVIAANVREGLPVCFPVDPVELRRFGKLGRFDRQLIQALQFGGDFKEPLGCTIQPLQLF